MFQQEAYIQQPYTPQSNEMSFDVLRILAQLEGVYIRQKFNKLQAFTGWQQQNTYYVYQGTFSGEQAGLMPLFLCQEQSECLQRVCLPTDCRAFQMWGKFDQLSVDNIMHFEKNYSLVCCCWSRPEMFVRVLNKGNTETIGRILNPCFVNCCMKGLNIFDANNELVYTLRADVCQLANWCVCPCEPCQYIEFKVLDKAGQHVSTCIKRSAGCCKQCLANTDNFQIQFPATANPKSRALLLAAVILLDYRYFEYNKDQQI